MSERIVVVGASIAGVRTALALRGQGFEGELVLVGDESQLPYDKPPLSKQFLSGQWNLGRFTLLDEHAADAARIDLRLGAAAVGLAPSASLVELSDGRVVPYDRLVVATGASARPSPWNPHSGLHRIRSVADIEALTADLRGGGDVAVIGAGVVGCEVAATLRMLGHAVTLVDTLTAPMERVVGPDLAARFLALHHRHGVTTHLGTEVRGISGCMGDLSVDLADGATIKAAAVVVGIGSVPNDSWLRGSGLALDGGVRTDEFGRAEGFPDIYAVGDVANRWHSGLGRHHRSEHWSAAAEDGVRVAHNILHPGSPAVLESVPYVWSHQYDWKIQVAGFASDGKSELVGDLSGEKPKGAALYADGSGCLARAVTVNWPSALVKCRRHLDVGGSVVSIRESLEQMLERSAKAR
ncbi:NAD(P)/FAD-dependent oxidoreductase [Amycolatopsis pithecellobii]|uniref:NAD(P)/FAD-dependent oxidoreductase n=1 Tax=Amycolatopsis pithecellobii TaxID=664692 RepID=A0A6N7Z6W8_9PSEU|nr:FAD-dependent oxidoreductase [Amycolatopsis pithecellobii]MTD55416.1 NAD(P)/FAD-dependent oxidoreductase [Amycolatopsis pithecellobii]